MCVLRDAIVKSAGSSSLAASSDPWAERAIPQSVRVRSERSRGQLKAVEIGFADPTKSDDFEQPVPSNLNYDMWLGSTPEFITPSNACIPQDRWPEFPSRLVTPRRLPRYDHRLGCASLRHRALGHELRTQRPVQGRGQRQFPTNKDPERPRRHNIELLYPGNIKMTVSDRFPNGIKFIGDDGWIFVSQCAGHRE